MSNQGYVGLTFLKIYLKDGSVKNMMSLESEDKRSKERGVSGLVRRMLYRDPKEKGFKGMYVTALLIDNKSRDVLHKWINGIKEF